MEKPDDNQKLDSSYDHQNPWLTSMGLNERQRIALYILYGGAGLALYFQSYLLLFLLVFVYVVYYLAIRKRLLRDFSEVRAGEAELMPTYSHDFHTRLSWIIFSVIIAAWLFYILYFGFYSYI